VAAISQAVELMQSEVSADAEAEMIAAALREDAEEEASLKEADAVAAALKKDAEEADAIASALADDAEEAEYTNERAYAGFTAYAGMAIRRVISSRQNNRTQQSATAEYSYQEWEYDDHDAEANILYEDGLWGVLLRRNSVWVGVAVDLSVLLFLGIVCLYCCLRRRTRGPRSLCLPLEEVLAPAMKIE